jgi:ADP-heptose:LPS heptosyltransferase
MALVAHCDLFISPDTGPMHVAVAFGVPTVAIFLEDNFKRYGPVGPANRIVRASIDTGGDEVLGAFAELVATMYRNGAS